MSPLLTHLLDTNILSALIRDPAGSAVEHLRRCGDAAVCTSIVVAGELRFGARKRGSERLAKRVEALLAAMPVLGIDTEVDRRYAEIRWALEKAGTPIGPNDLWIAAQALHANLSLVTANESEFQRVAGLKVENWLA